MKKYFITVDNGQHNHAGSKARNDIDEILRREGFQEIFMPESANVRWYKKPGEALKIAAQLPAVVRSIAAESTVVLQFPTYQPMELNLRLVRSLKKKRVKIILLIHDLDWIRGMDAAQSKKQRDFLQLCDHLISHNGKMTAQLRAQLPDANIVDLEIFDYLLDDDVVIGEENKRLAEGAVVAGSLRPEKAAYIYDGSGLFAGDAFNLFGPYFDRERLPEGNYCGQFGPEEVIERIHGSFGLVWDGASCDTCSGSFGDYLRYNNPHKTSMYLVAGFPVAIWSQAALADFVTANGVGITLDSLYELEEKKRALSPADYYAMVERTRVISDRMRRGWYTKRALRAIDPQLCP